MPYGDARWFISRQQPNGAAAASPLAAGARNIRPSNAPWPSGPNTGPDAGRMPNAPPALQGPFAMKPQYVWRRRYEPT